MTVIEETIPQALAGERVDRVVSLVLDVSRSDAARIVELGGVVVDGASCTSGKMRLVLGSTLTIDAGVLPRPEGPLADPTVACEVIHADGDIIVVNKQPGLVVHPGAGNATGTLVNGLLAIYPEIAVVGEPTRPGIVHRLDAGTSGLMVVARTQGSYERLVQALQAHEVQREYLALVWGGFDAPTGVIDAPIGRSPRDPLRMAVVNDGKPARTHFEVLRTFAVPAHLTLLRCRLETGRTHQIRVHLAAAGHPVVGDATYGGARSALVSARPMLHAGRLGLVHPSTGERMTFEQDPPGDFASVLGLCS